MSTAGHTGNAGGTGRRQFIIGIALAAGELATARLYGRAPRQGPAVPDALGPPQFQPHAFLRIGADDVVTVIIGKSEMGQGVHTGLVIPVAEELDIDPQRIRVEFAGVDPAFNNPLLGEQLTGVSMSTWTTFDSLRKVGATARAALLAAAARRWNVDVDRLRSNNGRITDGTRSARYGELATLAAKLPLPPHAALKDPSRFKYIGHPQHRLDGPDKVTGRAKFGMDIDLPGLLTAVVARAPVFGGRLVSFDATAARAVPGVVDVRPVPSGVAVYASHTWAAMRGREALTLQWEHGTAEGESTATLRNQWRQLLDRPGAIASSVGDTQHALASASKRIEIEYEFPYLAHACMEPLNCTAHVTPDGCEIWVGTQNQTQDRRLAAEALGIEPARVKLHTTYLGGGFGRRGSGVSDFTVEAVHVANGMGRPVKTVWTREDDMRGGYYRPFSLSRVRAGIDATGIPTAIEHRIVSKSIFSSALLTRSFVKDGIDPSTVEGATQLCYAVPNHRVEMHSTDEAVPVLWWRSVGHSTNAFVINTLIDELAVLGGKDPVALRRMLLSGKPRHLAVLERAVRESGYGSLTLPSGHVHGVALHESFGSIVAQVAQLSVEGPFMEVCVHRVTCVIDCGLAVNPDQVVAQMQSGIIFGLSAALDGEILLENGRIQQGNFDDYPVLRMNQSPRIDVHIIANGERPGGVGETGTPPIAPAVCNGIHAAIGRRIRRLPIRRALRFHDQTDSRGAQASRTS